MRIQDLRYASYRGTIPRPGTCGTDDGTTVELANELHGRILVARALARFHRDQLDLCGVADHPFAIGDAYSEFTASDVGAALQVEERGHVATERDATAIAYEYAYGLSEDFVYANDLARMKSGFDLVTRSANCLPIFTEIKGTRGTEARSLVARLSNTRHKGRQLSHRWIWASLLEAGRFSGSASLFLRCLRPVLAGAYRRRALAVSIANGSVTSVLGEDALASIPALDEPIDLAEERSQLAELDHVDGSALGEYENAFAG